MKNEVMRLIVFQLLFLFSNITVLHAKAIPKNYPNDHGIASNGGEFDWQSSWGTIHLNSMADGFADPISPSSKNSVMPCENGSICIAVTSQMKASGNGAVLGSVKDIGNGIKYDIKRSVTACMSNAVPNWAKKHGPPSSALSYQVTVCNAMGGGQKPGYGTNKVIPPAMLFFPIWDKRSNDVFSIDYDAGVYRKPYPGCIQQLVNTCIQDIHECQDLNDKWGGTKNEKGYENPVTHVFTPQEIEDLTGETGGNANGKSLPSVYYQYEKITKTNKVTKSLVKPSSGLYMDESVDSEDCSSWGSDENIGKIKDDSCVDIKDVQQKVSCDNLDKGQCDCTVKSWKDKTCKFYNYTQITEHRPALTTDSSPSDLVPGYGVKKISNEKIDELSRIKTFKFTDTDKNEDQSTFIVVDPSDFFDLKLYQSGGKYESGYDSKALSYKTQTPDTCPVNGLSHGYGGICDPNPDPAKNAGCNLPIYLEGPETNFKDADNKNFKFNTYPIKWSGYVKSWEIISAKQYLENIKGREAIYLDGSVINSNPVVMITRHAEYCDAQEMASNLDDFQKSKKIDLPCIQYLQFQKHIKSNGDEVWDFVDLYYPVEIPYVGNPIDYNILILYNQDANGNPISTSKVAGTGDDWFIGGDRTVTGKYVSFKDKSATYRIGRSNEISALINANYGSGTVTFDDKGNRKSGVVLNQKNEQVVGEYLAANLEFNKGCKVPCRDYEKKGTGMTVKPGTAVVLRTTKELIDPENELPYKEETCKIVSYPATGSTSNPATGSTSKLFIPTNSTAELEKFYEYSAKNILPNGIRVRDCERSFHSTSNPVKSIVGLFSKGTSTWVGKTSCKELTERPACNQVKKIMAQRFCRYEDDTLATCSACKGIADVDDSASKFTHTTDNDLLIGSQDYSYTGCYFEAACFDSASATGCPGSNENAGHVFCLSADTQILMADGKHKPISKIKAGEAVMGFDALYSRSGSLHKAKVKATAVTKRQEILKINDLEITPEHKVVLANGRAIQAREVRKGDSLLRADGTVEVVEKVQANLPRITVYNLVLNNGSDGYIANGKKVFSYPDMKGLK